MPVGRPCLVAALLVALLTTAACTAQPTSSPSEAPQTSSAPPATPAPSAVDPVSTTPLVVALHPTRSPLDLSAVEVGALKDGEVIDWSELGAGPAALRTGALAEVRTDRDVVAVVPAHEVRPPLTVATVDGVDPLRDPSAYAVTTDGLAPPTVTTVTVTGDVMLGRRVGDHLAEAR